MKKGLPGVLTVEASFVIGTIVVIILVMVSGTMSLYNRVVKMDKKCRVITETTGEEVWDSIRLTRMLSSIAERSE